MSNQKTGFVELFPGTAGLLTVREDIASFTLGNKVFTVPATSDTLAGLTTSQSFTAVANQLTTTTVGTVTTTSTTAVAEHGDGTDHTTVLTMTNFAIGTIADNAALGIGAKFYTFPSGTILVEWISMVGGVTGAVSVTAQTPEVGIGSVIASGAVAVLSGTATFEDYIDGNASGGTNGATTAPDIAGTVFYKFSRNNLNYIIKTSGGAARDVFLNMAATWADVTAAGAGTYTGTIVIKWKIIGA